MDKKKSKQGYMEEIKVPEGSEARLDKGVLCIKGKQGEDKRNFSIPGVDIEIKDGKIILSSKHSNNRFNKLIKTFKAHINNMIRGTNEGHKYLLKVCSSHFPISVAVQDKKLVIKNFVGEKVPRTVNIGSDIKVTVDGAQITVESINKEKAGQFAAFAEGITKRPGYDKRIFQDGIYITNKDGKNIK